MNDAGQISVLGFVVTSAEFEAGGYMEFVAIPLTFPYLDRLLADVRLPSSETINSPARVEGAPLLLSSDPSMDDLLTDVPLLLEPGAVLDTPHQERPHAWLATHVSRDLVAWHLRLYAVDGPYRTAEVEPEHLLRVALAGAPPERVPEFFQELAESAKRAALALEGRFFDHQTQSGPNIAPFLKRSDLMPLIQSDDAAVREGAIAALGRTAKKVVDLTDGHEIRRPTSFKTVQRNRRPAPTGPVPAK